MTVCTYIHAKYSSDIIMSVQPLSGRGNAGYSADIKFFSVSRKVTEHRFDRGISMPWFWPRPRKYNTVRYIGKTRCYILSKI